MTDNKIHDPLPPSTREGFLAGIVGGMFLFAVLIYLFPASCGAQRAPVVGKAVSPVEVESSVGVSAQVIAASDPLAPQEPDAPVKWVVEYPYPGRKDYLTVWPEGL